MATGGKKRSKNEPPQALESSTTVNTVHGLLDCYDILAKNEYSEETIGIQAFFTRKHVGNDNNNNFSDLIDENYKRCQQGNVSDFHVLLDEKRKNLPGIDASVEKCLMLTRLVTFAQEKQPLFTRLVSDIRVDMQTRMTADDRKSIPVDYPVDFRKREQDFYKRQATQEKRRIFYFSHQDVHPLQNLVYLQNRTTEHFKHLVHMINTSSKNQSFSPEEIQKIIQTSFMIVAHPHCGMNPTTIYERKGPGQYVAKVNVVIISLLNDFMQLYPNLIEIYPIEPSLHPSSDQYKLEEPQSLSWKTCQLQPTPESIPRTFKYAEITTITIGQTSKSDTRVRFAQGLHSFKFAIKVRVNLAHSNAKTTYHIPLESGKFAIGAHNNQLPHLLTRVILDDIRKFNRPHISEVSHIHEYIQRYFIYRTGVRPNHYVCNYLEQELNRAKNNRSQYTSYEEIYLDFLANFVSQVEFMAKHPILAMFHADNLFLSICNGDRVAEAIIQTCGTSSPVIGLRFNSIRIDYDAIAAASVSSRTIKTSPCAVRVDIYNDRSKKFQNRTFDSTSLLFDISKFIISAHTSDGNRIRILSNFDSKTNEQVYESLDKFQKYFNERLKELVKTDEKYKPVTDLVDNANETAPEEIAPEFPGSIAASSAPASVVSLAPTTPDYVQTNSFDNFDHFQSYDYSMGNHVNTNNPFAQPTQIRPVAFPFSPHATRPPMQPNQYIHPESIAQFLLSQPRNIDMLRQMGIFNIAEPILPGHQQPPPPYQASPSPYPQANTPYASAMSPHSPIYHSPQAAPYYSPQHPRTPMAHHQLPLPQQQPSQLRPSAPHQIPPPTTTTTTTDLSTMNHLFVQDTPNLMQSTEYLPYDSCLLPTSSSDDSTNIWSDATNMPVYNEQTFNEILKDIETDNFDLQKGTETLNINEI